jgi:dihydroneopterin aldolase
MVHLGYGELERATAQEITLDITLYFSNPPVSTLQDGTGFLCYHSLCDTLESCTKQRSYALIEYLATHYANTLSAWLASAKEDTGIEQIYYVLRLHKCHAPVPALHGGASYSCTNLPQGLR